MDVGRLYFYAKLSDADLMLFRVGGAGLANNLFLYARSIVFAHKFCGRVLRPSWEKISIGPMLRGERDKRLYFGLFRYSVFSILNKIFVLTVARRVTLDKLISCTVSFRGVRPTLVIFNSIDGYFDGLRGYSKFILSSIEQSSKKVLPKIEREGNDLIIGFHVRLGDYSSSMRTSLEWYVWVVNSLTVIYASRMKFKIILFSDGLDTELIPLLSESCVERSSGHSALSDLYLLSQVDLLIGSDSTFSGWASFLGQIPSIFNKIHFDLPLEDPSNLLILPNCDNSGFSSLSKFLKMKVRDD